MSLHVITPPAGFEERAAAVGIVFDDGDLEKLGRYLSMLLETNRQFNLTAISDPDDAWDRHVLDSLTLVPMIASAGATTVADVGSGGGLPGIPLAICVPGVQFTLIEATGKKARFLESVVGELSLSNVRVVCERAETVGRDREHHRACYDVVVSRAVGRLRVLLELTVPLVREGGHVLAVKGARAEEEIEEAGNALHRLHAGVVDVEQTPTGRVVIIEKFRTTPKIYPRRPGEPKRAPL